MLLFQKITKKQAINELKENQNILVGSVWKDQEEAFKLINENYENIESKILRGLEGNTLKLRKAEKIQSNAIKFTFGSWLYFDTFKEAYKYKKWILLTSKDNTMVYRIF